MSNRIHNFNAGPSALPLPVLEEVQAEFLDFKNTGMSITEISHRAAAFDEVLNDAVARVKRVLSLPDNYNVFFTQGGASSQFYQIPMNLSASGQTVDYIDTGTWSAKAVIEAENLGRKVNMAGSSKDKNYCYIPKELSLDQNAAYVHMTSNNTIKGTQFADFPETGNVPLVVDMSSDIMSRSFNFKHMGMIYAGAQKNLGPAGVTLVIIRDDMLERVSDNLPSMLSYKIMVEKNSTYNTPPCFAIYVVQLVLKWLEETMGGLAAVEAVNAKKADLLYGAMDVDDYYQPTADLDSRSKMNVTFRLGNEDLEKKFVADAAALGLGGLKGHRSVGGCRVSIYNAVSEESVQALVDFMNEFKQHNG